MKDNEQHTDDSLRALFSSYNPELPDSDDFARRLEIRLEAAAYIRECRRRDAAIMRSVAVFTLVLGFVLGIGASLVASRLHISLHTVIPGLSPTLLIYLGASAIVLTASALYFTILRLRPAK